MPRIFGLNTVGVLIAAVVFYFVGFVWFGILFSEAWQVAQGVTTDDFEGQSGTWMALGIVMPLLQAIGIGLVLKWREVTNIGTAVLTVIALWFFFGVAIELYDYVYLPAHSVGAFLIDAGHMLVGWILCAIILVKFK